MNHLGDQQSLYLKQHENNPVEWLPFAQEALQKAKEKNLPIFLSIGYSSCHWCHVMAHESFEDQETADLLNQNFVSIKVDREEFPDVDSYYQGACQLFTGRGGWPLSAFLTPDLKPYFVGTYFPLNPRQGMSSFKEVLREMHRLFTQEREKIEDNSKQVKEALEKGLEVPQNESLPKGQFPTPMAIFKAMEQYQDNENGGYGEAPKFPSFAFLEWAIEQTREGALPPKEAPHIRKSLEAMLAGGLFDHLRGGIHRYSVDPEWRVPHFEKMLYDQAGMLKVYAKMYPLFPSPLIKVALESTLDYLEKEMLSEKGHFFSAQDADSEGEEGLYFSFTVDELKQTLGDDYEVFQKFHEFDEGGNFERGLNVISLDKNKLDEAYKNWDVIVRGRQKLLKERSQRIPPATDIKGVASWNFHLLSGLCDVAQYVPEKTARDHARQLLATAQEIIQTFYRNGQVQHSSTLDETSQYLEDYALLSDSSLRIYELTGEDWAKQVALEAFTKIRENFFRDDYLYNRTFDQSFHQVPTQKETFFDASFRSPAATSLMLCRRLSVLAGEPQWNDEWEVMFERARRESLANPVGCGEALRVLTYPLEAFRVLKVPKAWLQEEKFNRFLSVVPNRFVFSYGEGQRYEICNLSACERTGEGLENFIKELTPQNETP